MVSVRVVLRALSNDRARTGIAAVAAPAIAATAVGRSVGFAIVTVLAAGLLTLLGSAYTLRGGSLGAAIAIASLHGARGATVAIALAGILAAGLAIVGAERVIRTVPARAIHALLCAFAVAALVRVLPLKVHGHGGSLVGDTLALALLLCCESAALERSKRDGAVSHLTAASFLLPLGFSRRVSGDAVPITAFAASAVIVALLLSPFRDALTVMGVFVFAVSELATRARALGVRGAVVALAIASAAVFYRPAVAVVFAIFALHLMSARAPEKR